MFDTYSFSVAARRAFLSVLGLSLAFTAQAQLGTYSFGTTPPSSGAEATYDVDAQPANATFSPISRGSGITPAAGTGTFSASGWTTTASPDPNDYFAFSITPADGATLNLTSITLDERRSGSGITEWVLRSSIDNFLGDITKVTVPDNSDTRTATNIKLPVAFQGLKEKVEFRLYGYKAEADGGTWRVDNVKVDGTITPGGGTPTATVISFGSAAVSVEENVGTVKIPVKLSAASTKEIMVDVVLATPAGTATTGDDFTFTKTTVTFPANTTEKTVDVVIVDDNVQEAAETIILGLENAMPAADATIAAGTSTITINANDVPVVTPVTPIATLTVNDAAGVPTMTGQKVKATGIIHGTNTRTAGYQVSLIDATGGIGIFSSANINDITLAEGDTVDITGTLGQFNGLTQITATEITKFGTRTPYSPRTVTTALTENEESELITVGPVTVVDPTKWLTNATGSGYTVDVKDAAGTVYAVRIVKGTDVYNSPAPTGAFTLTGLGGQFDNATPFDGGYQITPRRLSDIKTETSTANREPGFGRFVTLAPNPATNVVRVSLGTAGRGTTVEVLSLLGQRISRTTATGAEVKLTVGSLQQGVYLVRLTNAEGSVTRRFVKQ